MNEINFNVEDIEQVDLSIGMGIKEIYPPIENLEVTPTKEQQVFNHENSYGYDEVVVEPIPDEYIIPDGTLPITENATYDVRKFARVSTSVYPTPNLQEKELTINENGTYNITADEEYDGLNQVSVTVDAIENLDEELETYNTELTEQETTINDIVETLKTKAIGGGDSSMEIYSKEEVQIGTWIDGRPLYRRYIDIGNLSQTNTDVNLTDYGIDAHEVRFYRVYKYAPDGVMCDITPQFLSLAGGLICRTILYKDEWGTNILRISVGPGQNGDITGHTAYGILEYTKPTE